MSFSVVLFHNPHSATPTLPTTICTISSSSSSFRPRKTPSSSTNRIFPINQPKPLIKKLQIETLAARDTIIDFGKHKGKMLGSLPSSYLKWVSKNLRAGDSEFWAKLADEVLEDDVYKDRTEWEFAEKILRGSDESMKALTSVRKNGEEANSVSMLLEISERFGWDNEDKIGWSKINFELLGTSKGGRIPRLRQSREEDEERREMVRRREINKKEKEEDGNGWRRRERRERLRQSLGREKEAGDDGKTVNRSDQKGILGKLENIEKQLEPKIYSPFPGRESLLKKVMNKRGIQ
ncbi:hypothetical protein EUTSA_v10012117mg [Eutrema salsugineum]|uniref:Uncharacterized protein n=1 Tax=Eutrema salsugineum TaxID=72664 RepID=V4MGB2_EUTSA|nr:uncharacterized protein LOC18010870 [Eutrema salsugineum]ESQ30371.1 hypothetical protein EUTSA_v10012117mg [Eutrema salsugineum]